MGQVYGIDKGPVAAELGRLVGELSDDEAALVRILTPTGLGRIERAEHIFDLVELIEVIRQDDAVADYVFGVAPTWDGGIDMLLLGGQVTTAFARMELAPARVA